MTRRDRRGFWWRTIVSGAMWFREVLGNVGAVLLLLAGLLGVSLAGWHVLRLGLWPLVGSVFLLMLVVLGEGAFRVWRNAADQAAKFSETKSIPVAVSISIPQEIAGYATRDSWSLYVNFHNEGEEGTFRATAQWITQRASMHQPWKVCWGGISDKRHEIGSGEPNTLHLVKVTRTHGGGLARPLKSTDPLDAHQDPKDPVADEMGICLSIYRQGASDFLRMGLRFEPHPTYIFQLVRDDSILPPTPASERPIS